MELPLTLISLSSFAIESCEKLENASWQAYSHALFAMQFPYCVFMILSCVSI